MTCLEALDIFSVTEDDDDRRDRREEEINYRLLEGGGKNPNGKSSSAASTTFVADKIISARNKKIFFATHIASQKIFSEFIFMTCLEALNIFSVTEDDDDRRDQREEEINYRLFEGGGENRSEDSCDD